MSRYISKFINLNNVFRSFCKSYEKNHLAFQEKFNAAKKEFMASAPYFSRYVNLADITILYKGYYPERNASKIDIVDVALKDMKYGEKRRKLVHEIQEKLSTFKLDSPFDQLPTSRTGKRMAAVFLNQIANWNLAHQTNSKEQFSDYFKILRSDKPAIENIFTIINSKYQWGGFLAEIVHLFSQEISPVDLTDEALNHAYDNIKFGYTLNYKINEQDLILNKIVFVNQVIDLLSPDAINQGAWLHGQAPIDGTWPQIENIFEDLLEFDFSKSTHHQFYEKAAELVWLIGNTQPMLRGSGTFAELMFAFVHEYHGLTSPVLKAVFPQLDVLDITFPLKDYQKLFLLFFEQTTLPESVRKQTYESQKTAIEQLINAYMSELNIKPSQLSQDKLNTHLLRSAKQGNLYMVNFLLENGADKDTQDKDERSYLDKKSALHYAAIAGHKQVVSKLLEAGVNYDLTDAEGNTPLMTCLESIETDAEIVSLLVKAGTNLNIRNSNDYTTSTALEIAIRKNNPDLINILVEQGKANLNDADPHGYTPLQIAVRGFYKEAAATLIQHGASLDPVDQNGNPWVDSNKQTLREIIEKRGWHDIIPSPNKPFNPNRGN